MNFSVGVFVRLSGIGKQNCPSDLHGAVGAVVEITEDFVQVRWSSSKKKIYVAEELQLVPDFSGVVIEDYL